MFKSLGLYRIEFHASFPGGQAGNARYRKCCTMVGHWNELRDAVRDHRQDYWVMIFDAATGKPLAGPLAPDAQAEYVSVIP